MEHYVWLIPVGFIIGTYGTLVGAGGGFLVVPLLLVLYQDENPEIITSISLAVIAFNALSGSVAYARMSRINYKAGILFSIAAIPGAVLGALSTALISRLAFDVLFGLLIIVAAVYLLLHPMNVQNTSRGNSLQFHPQNPIEADHSSKKHLYKLAAGIVLSFFVGYLSSLLGIGGGIIHVPVLVRLLDFPVHIATATSHFILAIMALTGTIVHIITGTFYHGVHRTIALSIGVICGAQVGALLSNRLSGAWIIRGLAVALGGVGLRLLLVALL